jgi:hypothetical protein
MTRAERRALDDAYAGNSAQLGPDGIIHDGGKFRFPLMFKDARTDMPRRGTGTASDPIVITTSQHDALATSRARAQKPTTADSERAARDARIAARRDARDVKAITHAVIATQAAIDASAAAEASHRPGFRFGDGVAAGNSFGDQSAATSGDIIKDCIAFVT